MNTQTIFGLCSFVAFALGLLLFVIYKAKTVKFTYIDGPTLAGYIGKGLIALAILFNALGNYYGGLEKEKEES